MYSNTRGFTYVEIIFTTLLIALIGVGMYRVNTFFLNNSTENRQITVANQFSNYVSMIVKTTPIPPDLTVIPNQTFYIQFLPDGFVYTANPNFKTNPIGFFNSAFDGEKNYTHEIRYLGTGSLADVSKTFYYFQATVGYEWKNISFPFVK